MLHRSSRVALVTQATPDYSSTDLCGGKITFANIGRGGAACSGLVKRLNLLSIDAIGVASAFLLFRANPAASTFTENGAFTIHADDLPNLLRAIPVPSASWVTLTGTAYYEQEIPLSIPFEAPTEKLYGALIAGGTINLSTAASIVATLGVDIDR